MTSRPAPASNADGSWTTLGQFLSGLLPHLSFSNPTAPAVASAEQTLSGMDAKLHAMALASEAAGPAGAPDSETDDGVASKSSEGQSVAESAPSNNGQGQEDPPSTAFTEPVSTTATPAMAVASGRDEKTSVCQALVLGIAPPLETPVAWLHANLHAPDYFVYIVVIPQ